MPFPKPKGRKEKQVANKSRSSSIIVQAPLMGFVSSGDAVDGCKECEGVDGCQRNWINKYGYLWSVVSGCTYFSRLDFVEPTRTGQV